MHLAPHYVRWLVDTLENQLKSPNHIACMFFEREIS